MKSFIKNKVTISCASHRKKWCDKMISSDSVDKTKCSCLSRNKVALAAMVSSKSKKATVSLV